MGALKLLQAVTSWQRQQHLTLIRVSGFGALMLPCLCCSAAAAAAPAGLDCVLPRDSSLALPVQKVLFSLLMPFAVWLLLFAMEVVLAFIRQLTSNRRRLPTQASARRVLALRSALPAGVIARAAIVLAFVFLPSLLKTAYGLFASRSSTLRRRLRARTFCSTLSDVSG